MLFRYSKIRHLIRYINNVFVSKIPLIFIRSIWYSTFIEMGENCVFLRGVQIRDPRNIKLGNMVNINQRCMLDSRGGSIIIGNYVDIAPEVNIWTLQHDPQNPDFSTSGGPVTLEDFVWIGNRAIVLPNITLGEGCVVAAGAVVTKDVEPWTIVGGIPARPIGKRNSDQNPRKPYKPFLL
jgi:acetyltransferase-like isoleucine patch superfamily enzyme